MSANYKSTAKQKRKEAKKMMTKDQLKKCHAIIHTASVASGAAGAIPIPVADALPISGIQITMVLSLGKVFEHKIGESTAKGLIASAASTFVGRNLVKLIPVVGWGISAAVAAGVTETIGWCLAVDFAKGDYVDGYADGCNDTSEVYEAKFAEQAKVFAKQAEEWSKTEQARKHTEEESHKLLEECLNYIADLEKERDSLLTRNEQLSHEKQELLEKLYGIRTKLCA